jgi:hypothetical protein
MRRARHLALLALLAPPAAGGCREADLSGGVSDSVFVRTMVELRRVQSNATLDSAGRAEVRRKALEKHRLTAAQLEEAAGELADDPARVSQVWQEIERRLATDAMRSGHGSPAP